MGFFEHFSQGNDVFPKSPYEVAGIDAAQAGSDDDLSQICLAPKVGSTRKPGELRRQKRSVPLLLCLRRIFILQGGDLPGIKRFFGLFLDRGCGSRTLCCLVPFCLLFALRLHGGYSGGRV